MASNTTLRFIEMLRMIPREPRKMSTTELREKLSDEGYDTTPRTIQRDLLTLSESFPLVCDDRSHPYGWSRAKHANTQSLPGMDTATALTFTLTEQYLSEMQPKGTGNRDSHNPDAEPHGNTGLYLQACIFYLRYKPIKRRPSHAPAEAFPARPALAATLLDGLAGLGRAAGGQPH